MKNVILFLLVLTSGILTAQMEVVDIKNTEPIGEFKTLGTKFAEITTSGDVAIFLYRNEKYEHIDDYRSFVLPVSDLEELHRLFVNFEGVEKGDQKKVTLDSGDVLVFDYGKMMGKMYAQVFHQSKGGTMGILRWMTEKQADKLFGKR